MRNGYVVLAGLLAGLAGCADKTPATVSFQPLPAMVSSLAPLKLAPVATNRAGDPLPEVPIAYETTPPGILVVDKSGTAFCARAGDTTLRITAGAASAEVPVKCRPVFGVRAPHDLSAFVGDGPLAIPASAVGPDGRDLPDVPLAFTSSRKDVLEVKDGKVVPVGVGFSDLEVAAGDAKTTVQVEVWEKVRSEEVKIDKDLTLPLIIGHYVVRTKTETPVKLSWKDAACEAQPAALQHDLRCNVAPTGTLVLENAARAKPAVGTLAVYRVP